MESKERYLPVLQITNENVDEIFPLLKSALFNSSFIAIDVEMTGLGNTKLLFNPEVDQRYKYMREMTKTLSTVSVGISCFRYNGCSSHGYNVQTFDILVLSDAPHQVQAGSLKFLREHGFDFNRQIDHGLSYTPGNDPQEKELSKSAKRKKKNLDCVEDPVAVPKKGVRDIFSLIVQANKALVLHNGFVDITFFYEHFYAELPSQLDTLVADLCAMFPKGIYDTKYLSEFVHRVPATYLQFVYIHELIRNDKTAKDGSKILLQFPVSCSETLSTMACVSYFRYQRGLNKETDTKENLCTSFAYHGWCTSRDSCVDSHCLSRIVSELSNNSNKHNFTNKKSHSTFGATGTNHILESYMKSNGIHRSDSQPKRMKTSESPDKSTSNSEEEFDVPNCVECTANNDTPHLNSLEETENNLTDVKDSKNCEGHSSGYDAFMTGFIFASHIAYGKHSLTDCKEFIAHDLGMEDHVNKVYLMCKNMPLLIKPSAYSKVSPISSAKLNMLRSDISDS